MSGGKRKKQRKVPTVFDKERFERAQKRAEDLSNQAAGVPPTSSERRRLARQGANALLRGARSRPARPERIPEGKRWCAVCGVVKSEGDFAQSAKTLRLGTTCSACRKKREDKRWEPPLGGAPGLGRRR